MTTMIKLWSFLILVGVSSISTDQSRGKRSLFDPWLGPPSLPSVPWSSPPKWIPKPPPVIITKEVQVPVNKFVPVEVAKYIPYPVEKIVEVPVDRIVRVPVDRIVRVPVEVPAPPPPAPLPQVIAIAQSSSAPPAAPPVSMPVQMTMPAPMAMPAPMIMPIQQSLIRPGLPLTVPILITAQGLSISTSGLINSAAAMDQMPAQTATLAAPMAPMPQMMTSPMALPMAVPAATPVSNNATVGISLILNGVPAQRLPQGLSPRLTYVNALPDVSALPLQGNSIVSDVALGDYGVLRWKRSINDGDDGKAN